MYNKQNFLFDYPLHLSYYIKILTFVFASFFEGVDLTSQLLPDFFEVKSACQSTYKPHAHKFTYIQEQEFQWETQTMVGGEEYCVQCFVMLWTSRLLQSDGRGDS